METQLKKAYKAPSLTGMMVKLECSFLQLSQRDYVYRGLDEPDDDDND